MIRAGLYLLAAGAIWMAEGFVFSQFLDFAAWQIILMTCMYAGLFALACRALFRHTRSEIQHPDSLPVWRYAALAPMLTLVLGSFASLPILLALSVLGRIV